MSMILSLTWTRGGISRSGQGAPLGRALEACGLLGTLLAHDGRNFFLPFLLEKSTIIGADGSGRVFVHPIKMLNVLLERFSCYVDGYI